MGTSSFFLSTRQIWYCLCLLLAILLQDEEASVVEAKRFVEVGTRPVYVPKLPNKTAHGQNKRYSFSWQASVDTTSGIAFSREKMQASPKTSINRHFLDSKRSNDEPSDVWKDVIDRLEKYPQWVVRGAVTFGLLRAVPVPGGYFSLQDRLFGINLLTFGRPQSQRFSFHQQQTPPSPPPQIPTLTEVAAFSSRGMKYNEICTVTIPIVGGLLALSKSSAGGSDNRGCLKFTLKRNEVLGETQIITEIRDYVPLLLGKKEPVRLWRKCLYLSTQSIVHAYVMWRFQRYCIHTSYHHSSEDDQPRNFDKTVAAVEGFASYSTLSSSPYHDESDDSRGS